MGKYRNFKNNRANKDGEGESSGVTAPVEKAGGDLSSAPQRGERGPQNNAGKPSGNPSKTGEARQDGRREGGQNGRQRNNPGAPQRSSQGGGLGGQNASTNNGQDARSNDRNRNRTGNRPNRGKPAGHTFGTAHAQVFSGAAAKPLADLRLSEKTFELLSKNGIKLAGDLTLRSERDMYRIQTFNKKTLIEVKNALSKIGLGFAQEGAQGQPSAGGQNGRNNPQNQQNQQGGRQQKQNGNQKVSGRKDDGTSRASDSREAEGGKLSMLKNWDKVMKAKFTEPPQKRPTAPLPVEEWKKVQKGGKVGFSDGFKTVIPPIYDEVWTFKEGLACVEMDEKCGFIDEKGELVIPCTYDTAMSFSEGLAMVVENGKCGYISKENELVIKCEYDAATAFEEGKAKVKQDSKWGVLSKEEREDGSVYYLTTWRK